MSYTLLIIAGLGAVAVTVSKVARAFVPEIVVFLALGYLIGPEGPIGLINADNIRNLELVTQVALGAVIFLIGDRLRFDDLRGRRRLLLLLNVAQMAASAVLVFLALRLVGTDVRVTILLALIAAESGVLTITATVAEQRSRGELTDVLLSSVGITNAVTAALFGLAFPFVLVLTEQAGSAAEILLVFVRLIVFSVLLGVAGGWVLQRFARVIETSGELLLFLLIVLTGVVGAAIAVQGSVVLSTLVTGLFVANAAPWLADRMFVAVRTLEAPIYLVFFVVAGASIHLDELASVGLVGAAYVAARALGKVGGSLLGARIAGRDQQRIGFGVGLGLLPHAGMAIALVAFVVERAPALGDQVSAVVLGSIVVFELGGPVLMRRVLRGADEAGKARRAHPLEELPDLRAGHTFERVLVPVGDLQVLLPRLPFLLDLVANMGAELIAVHVSRPGSGLPAEDEPQVLALVREVAEERNIPTRTMHRVSEGIAEVLVAAAREQQADLLVMGEPSRMSSWEPARWGQVSQQVIQQVEVPVLVYPVDPAHPEDVPAVYRRRAAQATAADAEVGNTPADESADL